MKRRMAAGGRLLLFLAAGIPWLSGCSSAPSGPVGITLQATLASPYNDDGAVFFTVTGGRIDSLTAPGYVLHTSRPGPNTVQVIVAGNLGSGPIARLYIADERLASQYTATVNQAAARASYAQRDPTSYSLTLKP
jgi:hypothetical protein